jgi:hypothetical protein
MQLTLNKYFEKVLKLFFVLLCKDISPCIPSNFVVAAFMITFYTHYTKNTLQKARECCLEGEEIRLNSKHSSPTLQQIKPCTFFNSRSTDQYIDFRPNTPCSLAWLVAVRNILGGESLWYRSDCVPDRLCC